MTGPELQPSSPPAPGEGQPPCPHADLANDQLIDLRVRLGWWNRSPWRAVRLAVSPWVGFIASIVLVEWIQRALGLDLLASCAVIAGVGLPVLILWGGVTYFAAHRAERRIFESLHRCGGPSIQQALTNECARVRTGRLLSTVEELAKSLCEEECGGFVVRCSDSAQPPPAPIAPITLPFEPIPLDDSDDAFQGMAETGETAAGISQNVAQCGPGTPKLATKPWRREVGWPGLLSIRTFMTLGFILVLFVHFTHGLMSWWLIPITFVAGPLALGLSLVRPGPGRVAWVFPGGIAVPTRWEGRHWRIIRRAKGILIVPAIAGTLDVVTTENTHTVKCTAAEAELALRAWFSLLPPPTDGQLQGVFGS